MPAKKMEIQIPTYLKCNYTNQKLKHLKLKNYHKTTTAYKNFSSYNNKKSRSKQQKMPVAFATTEFLSQLQVRMPKSQNITEFFCHFLHHIKINTYLKQQVQQL